jgi:hypothetical protein
MKGQRICRLLISGLLMLGSRAYATTLYVGTCHSSSYSTISAAVAAAPAGATIDVCPGTYAEQVFIAQQLTIEGITSAGGDRARIVVPDNVTGGPTPWQFVTDPFFSIPIAAQIYVNTPTTTPVKITNLTIDGTGEVGAPTCGNTGYWYTVGIYAWTSVTIEGVNTVGQGQTSCGNGIWAEQATASPVAATIKNSSVQNPSSIGVVLYTPTPLMTVSVTNNSVVTNAPATSGGSIALFFGGITGKISSNTILTAVDGIFDYSNNSSLTVSSNTLTSTQPNFTFLGNYTVGVALADPDPTTETYSDNSIANFGWGTYFTSAFAGTVTLKNNSIVNGQTATVLNCNNVTLSGNAINNAQLGFDQVPSGFSTTGKASFYNVNQFIGTTCP